MTGHLESLRPLAGKHVREAKTLTGRALEKECGVLGLVAPCDHRLEQPRFGENVIAAGKQRLPDLEARKGPCFQRHDAVSVARQDGADHASGGSGANDQDVSLHARAVAGERW